MHCLIYPDFNHFDNKKLDLKFLYLKTCFSNDVLQKKIPIIHHKNHDKLINSLKNHPQNQNQPCPQINPSSDLFFHTLQR